MYHSVSMSITDCAFVYWCTMVYNFEAHWYKWGWKWELMCSTHSLGFYVTSSLRIVAHGFQIILQSKIWNAWCAFLFTPFLRITNSLHYQQMLLHELWISAAASEFPQISKPFLWIMLSLPISEFRQMLWFQLYQTL